MRNPERIPDVIEALRKLWEKSPDLRLGQLIAGVQWGVQLPSDLFNVEDDVLINKLYETHAPGEPPPVVKVFPEGGKPEGFAVPAGLRGDHGEGKPGS